MRVLIVDDNDQSLYLLRTVLEGAGHEVWPAADGTEALERAQKQAPDAVISDILMPRMDGFALCRAMRGIAGLAQVPVLLYSATYTDARDRELGLSVGADRYLEKPMESADLLAELEGAVAERREGGAPARGPVLGEPEYLREYNERLVRKLEDKMLDLDRAYRELAESERRYHELFDVASDVIFTLAPDCSITLVNRRIQEILGHHPAEIVRRPCVSLVTPSARDRAKETFEKALAGQRVSIEIDFLASDGRGVPMSVVIVPLWQGQNPVGLMGIARDMSDQARMTAARVDEAVRRGRIEARRDVADELEASLAQATRAARELAERAGPDRELANRLVGHVEDLARALDGKSAGP
ncbi:MAG: response regulator [Candidatus Eisenbacteria bacterium]